MSEYIVKCKEFVGISGKTMKFPEYIDLNQEIVRCRDCKFKDAPWNCAAPYHVEPDGFCAWGERREL